MKKILGIIVLHVICCSRAFSVGPAGALDLSFNPGRGLGGVYGASIQEMFLQTNGQMLITGSFPTFNGITYQNVVRLDSDGTVDTSFYVGEGPNDTVFAAASQTNGMILIGGQFNTITHVLIQIIGERGHWNSPGFCFVIKGAGNETRQGRGVVLLDHLGDRCSSPACASPLSRQNAFRNCDWYFRDK